jgi:acyl-coenzyme A thioesterase PaaI-like protein
LHIIDDARDVAEVRVSRATVRQGRTMGFSRSEITDAANPSRLIAVTTGVGVKLGDAPPSFRPVDPPPETPDRDNLPPLHVVFGAQRHSDGWRLPALNSRLASTSASLHLGPIHVVFEAAATGLAIELARSEGVQVEDWDVHFVAPGRVGPFLVVADGSVGPDGRVAVRFTLVDEGRDGSVVAVGAATFRDARHLRDA